MIIFFYGDETFRPAEKIAELKKKFLAKNTAGEGLVFVDFDAGATDGDATHAIGAQNLFAQKKLVIVKNIFANTKADAQKKVMERLQTETDDVIVLWETSAPRKNNALFKWLVKNADKTQEYTALEGSALTTWTQKHLATVDAEVDENDRTTIASDALSLLTSAAGSDLHRLDQELKKLVAYSGGTEITAEMVEELVYSQQSADIFQTIDALARGDKKTALTLLRTHLAAGDDPHYIFSMYVYQLRTLLTIGSFVWAGESDRFTIAKQAKLHPFVVQKSLPTIHKLSQQQLTLLYRRLLGADRDIKTGARDIGTVLDLFIVKM